MENDFKPLSQEDIDAMLSGNPLTREAARQARDREPDIPPPSSNEPPPKVINVTEMRLAQKLAQESSLPVPPAMTPPSVRYPAAYDDAPMQFPSPVGQPRSGDAAWSAASGRSQDITSRLELLERSATENSQALDQMQQQLGVIAERVNALAARFEEIAQGLRDTPNYKVREHFVCGSCNSKGSVAAPIKCTECGKINWWGWWPSRGKGER